MENYTNIEYLEPTLTERKVQNDSRAAVIASIVFGLIIISGFLITIFNVEMSFWFTISVFLLFVLAFCAGILFLFQPIRVREINQTILKTVEKPIITEVPVVTEVPVIQEVVVEKPVYRDIVRNVYVSKKADVKIPKYNYLGSVQTKTYHSRNCRLGKLIKRKYKISNNSKSFFIKKKFKACKMCIRKKK